MATTAVIQTAKVNLNGSLDPMPIFGITSALSDTDSEMDEGLTCRIAKAAYYKALARGFEPGHEMDDWLAAEAEQLA